MHDVVGTHFLVLMTVELECTVICRTKPEDSALKDVSTALDHFSPSAGSAAQDIFGIR